MKPIGVQVLCYRNIGNMTGGGMMGGWVQGVQCG